MAGEEDGPHYEERSAEINEGLSRSSAQQRIRQLLWREFVLQLLKVDGPALQTYVSGFISYDKLMIECAVRRLNFGRTAEASPNDESPLAKKYYFCESH